MMLTKKDITVKNIIQCSADAERCSAERYLFIEDFIFGEIDFQKPIADIKNEINLRYNELCALRKSERNAITSRELIGEKLFVCRKLMDLSQEVLADINVAIPKAPKRARISYWYSNRFAKEAYHSFESLFDYCEESLMDSIGDVCESIGELTPFGIVPITNSSDGRLLTFYRMIDKYDLKILSVCKIESPDTDSFTKFALVGKNVLDFDFPCVKKLEFTSIGQIFDLVSAIDLLGGKLGEITSIPSPYSETEFNNYLTVELGEAQMKVFSLYNYLFIDDVDVIGFYSEI